MLSICMLGFAGFLHYSELANQTELFIESNKVNQYRDWSVVAQTVTECCPMATAHENGVFQWITLQFRRLVNSNS